VCENYSGWTNRETWALALWLDNDEGFQERTAELTRDSFERHGTIDAVRDALEGLAEELFTVDGYREAHGDDIPLTLVSIAEDIGSLCRVNYYEIAEGYVSDYKDAAGIDEDAAEVDEDAQDSFEDAHPTELLG